MLENENIPRLLVHVRGGKIYDVTPALLRLEWSGNYKSPSRTLEFEILQSAIDPEVTKLNITEGSTCCFYVDDKELFRGTLLNIHKNSGDNSQSFTAKDLGFKLKNEIRGNFADKTAQQVAATLIKECGIKAGKLAGDKTKFTQILNKTTAYNGIMTFYTMLSKTTKKKYMVEADLDKLNIIEKGEKMLAIQFNEKENLINTDYSVDLEKMVNRIVVMNKDGNKLRTEDDKQLIKLYKYFMQKIEEETEQKTIADAKPMIVKPEKKCTLTGLGDIRCRTGKKVTVKDNYTGLVGEFYIDEDSHTWEGGKYNINLVLNFENLMDEHDDIKKEAEAGADGVASTKDWGHGVTAAQLNKVLGGILKGKGEIFLKYCNMYKINPAAAAAIAMTETGNGTSKMATDGRNNFFGMRNKNGWMHFSSVEEGIRRGIANISKNYVNKGLNSFEKMVGKYAEGGGSWVPACKNFYNKITGKSPGNFGTGVRTDAEAKANIIYTSNYDGATGLQAQALRFAEAQLGKQYSQKLRMNPGIFDCSSLCYRAYASAGVYDPKKWAFTSTSVHGSPGAYGLVQIPLSKAQPGDLLWKSGHMGIYTGNGRTIEAMSPSMGVRRGVARSFNCAYRYVGKKR